MWSPNVTPLHDTLHGMLLKLKCNVNVMKSANTYPPIPLHSALLHGVFRRCWNVAPIWSDVKLTLVLDLIRNCHNACIARPFSISSVTPLCCTVIMLYVIWIILNPDHRTAFKVIHMILNSVLFCQSTPLYTWHCCYQCELDNDLWDNPPVFL